MTGAPATIACLSARHPLVRRVRADWRRLTGGRRVRDADRPTLIACSGGADSSALALALAGVRPRPVLAHVLHDLRPPEDALADRDAARELAGLLGLAFAEASIAVASEPGNAEANARRARYRALDAIARERGCRFIVTGHHADDQLETVLMRLARGCSPRGLAGVHPTRPLSHATLVRPMLALTRDDGRGLCAQAGWAWREDRTNADTDRTRAAVRAHVLPELKRISPGVEHRVARAAPLWRDAGDLIEREARTLADSGFVLPGMWRWPLADLLGVPDAVLGAVVRLLAAGPGDGLGHARVTQVVRAIRNNRDRPRVCSLGPARVRVTGSGVEIVTEDAGDA